MCISHSNHLILWIKKTTSLLIRRLHSNFSNDLDGNAMFKGTMLALLVSPF